MTTSDASSAPIERPVSRLFADAMDAGRLARGEAPKAPLTDERVFDDDIEVLRCEQCGGVLPITGRLDMTGECACK